jgi:aminobenzoyl-glutamate transport protein
VVLPPLAAALYKAVGRSPLAGLAAVFAGVSAGFSANLFITGLEPMLAELTYTGARIIDEEYRVNPACNWWFMIGSTVVVTATGWLVTSLIVERRLKRRSPEDGGPTVPTEEDLAAQRLKPVEVKGLAVTGAVGVVLVAIILALIRVPGAPLYTYTMPDPADPSITINAERIDPVDLEQLPPDAHVEGDRVLVPSPGFKRWVRAIVPLLFFGFLIPGLAYGIATGRIRNDKDLARLMIDAIAAMAPIIVLAFVAGQFIAYFAYSGLDRMMAMAGGMWLGRMEMSPYMLIVAFIIVTLLFNLFMGSMSAKYTLFAPIFVPMFMMVGISPELTQAAYRVGDSVSNIITPLNAYLIIILVFMQKYVPRGGMGTLIATMFPYTVVFTVVWTIMLLIWMATGLPLGVDGGLHYSPH